MRISENRAVTAQFPQAQQERIGILSTNSQRHTERGETDVELQLSRRARMLLERGERKPVFDEFCEIQWEKGQEWVSFIDAAWERHNPKFDNLFNEWNETVRSSGMPNDVKELFRGGLSSNRSRLGNDPSDMERVTNLANNYVRLSQYLEDNFSGEELEQQQKWLSLSFDFEASLMALNNARIAESKMLHLARRSGLIALGGGEMIAHEKGEKERILDSSRALADGVREATNHFAHLTRQFVIENGIARSEQDRNLLETFLRDSEREEGRFTVDDMNSISNLLQLSSRVGYGSDSRISEEEAKRAVNELSQIAQRVLR